jgi:hypothetical protein
MGLEIDPAMSIGPKKSGEPQSCIGRNGSFSGNNLTNSPLGDPNRLCEPVLRYLERFQEVLEQDLSRMNWAHIPFHILSSISGNQ